MYIEQERKQGCCSSSSSSLSTQKKKKQNKQTNTNKKTNHQKNNKEMKYREFHVMARVYSFVTLHLMPAKLIPWFQQVEYILHSLQVNLHAPEPPADMPHSRKQKTFGVSRNHTVKVFVAVLQARPGQGRATSLAGLWLCSGQMQPLHSDCAQ